MLKHLFFIVFILQSPLAISSNKKECEDQGYVWDSSGVCLSRFFSFCSSATEVDSCTKLFCIWDEPTQRCLSYLIHGCEDFKSQDSCQAMILICTWEPHEKVCRKIKIENFKLPNLVSLADSKLRKCINLYKNLVKNNELQLYVPSLSEYKNSRAEAKKKYLKIYKKLSQIYHPDKCSEDDKKKCEDKFIEIHSCKEIIVNEKND